MNTILVADEYNDRIVRWYSGSSLGELVAGTDRFPGFDRHGHAIRGQDDELNRPKSMAFAGDGHILIVNAGDSRVLSWMPGEAEGRLVAGRNVGGQGSAAWERDGLRLPYGIAADREGAIFVSDQLSHCIVKYAHGQGIERRVSEDDMPYTKAEFIDYFGTEEGQCLWDLAPVALEGIVVAGGKGKGEGLNQLSSPAGIALSLDGVLFIADSGNCRVMCWIPGASQGLVIAGGNGRGDRFDQLNRPTHVLSDKESLVISDTGNNRVVRWPYFAAEGIVIAGGHGYGEDLNQFKSPHGISFDGSGNLLVADLMNQRIMMWRPNSIEGQILAGGELQQFGYPHDVLVEGTWECWSPSTHGYCSPGSRRAIWTVLLCQQRNAGLGSLGPLLTCCVLPWLCAVYVCPHRMAVKFRHRMQIVEPNV